MFQLNENVLVSLKGFFWVLVKLIKIRKWESCIFFKYSSLATLIWLS